MNKTTRKGVKNRCNPVWDGDIVKPIFRTKSVETFSSPFDMVLCLMTLAVHSLEACDQ